MSHRQRNVRIALAVLGFVVAVGAGVLIGVWLAAPSVTDIRNACVANLVVPYAGLPPGVTPGPRPAHRAVDTTPITPAAGQ